MARIVLDEAFQGANLPTPQMEVTTFSIPLRHHLLTTAGFLTALPKSLVHCSPDLKELAIALPRHNYPVAIVTVKNRILNPAADLFLERVRRFIRSGSKESLLSAVP